MRKVMRRGKCKPSLIQKSTALAGIEPGGAAICNKHRIRIAEIGVYVYKASSSSN